MCVSQSAKVVKNSMLVEVVLVSKLGRHLGFDKLAGPNPDRKTQRQRLVHGGDHRHTRLEFIPLPGLKFRETVQITQEFNIFLVNLGIRLRQLLFKCFVLFAVKCVD